MSRFRLAEDQPTPFSQARPDRFEFEAYQAPIDDDGKPVEGRAIDDASEHDERFPSHLANVGYSRLKRR